MRVVCISDTHERHSKVQVPDGDLLIHAGDFTLLGEADRVKQFNDWLWTLPHKHKVVIAGNHECAWSDNKAALLTACTYLQDSGCEIEGLKVYGSPFTPTFGHWAFMLPRATRDLMRKWMAIPHETDIVITHGPPFGILDQVCRLPYGYEGDPIPDGDHLGDFDLSVVVKAIAPKLHVFGHIHGGYGKKVIDRTTYVNAASVDEAYQPVNKPIVIEL